MLKPAPMVRADLLLLKTDAQNLIRHLGSKAVLHLDNLEEDDFKMLSRSKTAEDSEGHSQQLSSRVDRLFNLAGLTKKESSSSPKLLPLPEVENSLKELEPQLNDLVKQQREFEAKTRTLHSRLGELEALAPLNIRLEELQKLAFLHISVGTLKDFKVEDLPPELVEKYILIPHERKGAMEALLVAVSSSDEGAVMDAQLERIGFRKIVLEKETTGTPTDAERKLRKKSEELQNKIKEIEQAQTKWAQDNEPRLQLLARSVLAEKRIEEAFTKFGNTENLCLLRGWAPEKHQEELFKTAEEATSGRAICKTKHADDLEKTDQVPIFLDNPPIFRSFQGLVKGYGLPGYKDIDPTILVTLGFFLIFGLMFGDVGQGLVILGIGYYLTKKAPQRSGALFDAGVIMMGAGIMATIFGFMYGSIFSKEGLIHPLWMEPTHSILKLFGLTVGVGVVFVSVGVILNIINGFRRQKIYRCFFDKCGIIGLIFYWGGVGLILKYAILGHSGNPMPGVILFVLIPLGLLFIKEPLYNVISKKGHFWHADPITDVMEAAVETMETFTGYLANTVSFARVSAFALAHVGLSGVIFAIADMLSTAPAGTLLQLLIIIIGNVVVIALEGMVVTIQTVRLHYYEFFSKFLKGEGQSFVPFRI